MLRQPNNDRRSKLRQAAVVLFCLGLMAYFGHHAVHGRHGLEARTRLIERSSLLAFELRSLEAVRGKLERDVALLSPLRRIQISSRRSRAMCSASSKLTIL